MQLKERTEKLENWRMKEKTKVEKKKEKNELLRHKSSLWIDEPMLEKKMLEAIVNSKPLWVPLSYLNFVFGWGNFSLYFEYGVKSIKGKYVLKTFWDINPI